MAGRVNISFSEIGGLYAGNLAHAVQHVHQAVTIAVSFSGGFGLWCEGETEHCSGAVIRSGTARRFSNPLRHPVAFIHIDPFSAEGLCLTGNMQPFRVLDAVSVSRIRDLLEVWLQEGDTNRIPTELIIRQAVHTITGGQAEERKLDCRIGSVITLARNSTPLTLTEAACAAHLSTSRFSHLFRQQAGMSYRSFILYRKLVRSLKAICSNESLTQSSYSGGFADQAHFTRTFINAFGILPSQTVK